MTVPVYITRIAASMPFDPVSNDQMEQRLGLIGGQPSRARRTVLRSNGILSRHYVIDPQTGQPALTSAQLCAQAIRALFDGDEHQLAQVDCLVASSSAPDQLMPNHGVMVHGELGNPPCEVVSTAGICLCGLTALKYGWLAVASGSSQRAVAAASEVASNLMRADNFSAENAHRLAQLESHPEIAFDKDFLRWMLSDGAGAVCLEPQPAASGLSLRIDWIDIRSFANEQPACMYAGAVKLADGQLKGWSHYSAEERANQSIFAVKQDVRQLNSQIVTLTVERALAEIVTRRGLQPDDYAWFLPHYSSHYFRDRLLQGLTNIGFVIPQQRWFTNLSSKGNTGAASIYIMLDELVHSGRLQAGQRLLCYVPESGRFSSGFMQLTVVNGDEN